MYWTQENYSEALRYASEFHGDQRVPDSDHPYILHPALVAMELIHVFGKEAGGNEALAVRCALLHDVIEDTKCTYDDLFRDFGMDVANGVRALSKDFSIGSEDRIKECLGRIIREPHEIWMVKMADRIVNLGPPPGSWSIIKREKYLKDAVLIYDTLRDCSSILAERLQVKIENYRRYLKE